MEKEELRKKIARIHTAILTHTPVGRDENDFPVAATQTYLYDFISQELDKAREEGRREGDIASDFLYWHPLGGGMPDSSIRIGVEFEVGGCYEDWGFVIEENGKPISSGRTLKEAIDKLKTKEDGK